MHAQPHLVIIKIKIFCQVVQSWIVVSQWVFFFVAMALLNSSEDISLDFQSQFMHSSFTLSHIFSKGIQEKISVEIDINYSFFGF